MATLSLWDWLNLRRRLATTELGLAEAPPAVREGVLLADALEHLPLGLVPGEPLAGRFGPDWAEPDGLPSYTAPAPPLRPAVASPFDLLSQRFHCHGSSGGSAHTTVDYARVVAHGVTGLLNELEALRPSTTNPALLDGAELALNGLLRWAERYAELAEQRAEDEPDAALKADYLAVAERCRRVPREPARTLLEGLQTVWLTHVAVGLSECSGSSLSLGRLDQYLSPLYLADRERGRDETALAADVAAFYRLLNTFGDAACAVNLGGLGADGEDLFNPLSRLLVTVARDQRWPAPLLTARIHDGLAPDDFDLLCDPRLAAIGQPTFYGELPCRAALLKRGVPADEVHGWAANSCMGLMMPGAEWSNMWGTVVNLLLPLELALNGGRPLHGELPIPLTTPAPTDYLDFEALFAMVVAYLTELVDLLLGRTAEATQRRGESQPNPFVDALLRDCLARGRDRLLGGCRWQTVIVECFGLVNAADALVATRQLVFEQRRYSLAELVAAAKSDYAETPELLAAVRAAPKYGNDEPVADAMARRLADAFANAVERHTAPPLHYLPSFHTLNAHVGAGAKLSASLDGRRAGEPLAKNIGSTPGRATLGHTALLRSAAAIDQARFNGGQAIDLTVDLVELGTPVGKLALQALLRAYFALGGLQVQVNGATPELLRAALEQPEQHQDLLVRIAGYTARYVTLPRPVQEEMIVRAEAGL